MDGPIAADGRGNLLLAFDFGEEAELGSLEQVVPCAFSLVLVWHDGRCLLVFDRWKQTWELPGGAREEGETPREAALRELGEETGERPESLEYLGVVRIKLAADGREELGAVYQTYLELPQPFVANDEIEQVIWWDPEDPLDGADAPDLAVIRLAVQHRN